MEALSAPLAQEDYFLAGHLEDLFRSKIAKSQATGKDGMRIGRFQNHLTDEAALIEKKIKQSTYRFTTFKERLILRGADRAPRQISIPTVRDRLALRAVCQVLHNHVPETSGSSPHALVDQVVKSIRSGEQSSKVFVRIDVRDFFPSISHTILARELRHFGYIDKVRELCQLAVQTATGASDKPNERGVPQGLSISGALSAIYMLRFDHAQTKKTPTYFRYVDDILIICEAKEADDILKSVGRALRSRGLIIHKKGVAGKTEIGPVISGIDYLGYHISIDRISIRDSSFKKMFKNL